MSIAPLRIFLAFAAVLFVGQAVAQEVLPRSTSTVGCGGVCSVSLLPGQGADCHVAADDAQGVDQFRVEASGSIPFCLPELAECGLRVTSRALPLALRADVAHCGSSSSAFTSVGVGAARSFGLSPRARLLLGVSYRFLFHTLALAEDRASSSFSSVGVGLQLPLSGFTFFLASQNPERRVLDYVSRRVAVPSLFWASASWRGAGLLGFAAEVEKTLHRDPLWRMAVGVYPTSRLSLLAGFCPQGSTISVGTDCQISRFGVGVGISRNAQVGVTSSASVRFVL